MIATTAGGPDFLDSNIPIYAYDPTDPRKQLIAQRIIDQGRSVELVVSTQVLAEFTTTLLHKLRPAALPADVLKALDALSFLRVVSPDARMVRRAVEAHARYGLHFYDGMIVAAAERAGCSRIWSEDLNPGQTYFGVLVADPFN
jgi:predicted nucleic acid-binding protein